ncbi:MAG: CvpA family protein [Candidatus Margulisbacteria bacterium]|nr:CvpA family protein [Candidatus Margulisiibacteriota bacterium]
MLDVLIGIIILIFAALGSREGIAKSLLSVLLVFAALFLASGAVNYLAQNYPQFKDPTYIGATIIFLLVWLVSYLLIDFLLGFLVRRIIRIVILGPADIIGGILIGAFKGFLISGIILQLILYLPISDATKKQISESTLSRFSITAYHWLYPFAKKAVPVVSSWLNKSPLNEIKDDKKLEKKPAEVKEVSPDEFMGKVEQVKEVAKDQEKQIKKLLKSKKLLKDIPAKVEALGE